MNEQLIVKNFGPIKDATVDFKRVTVFIGPTGGGKSTLAKLLAMVKQRSILRFENADAQDLMSEYGVLNFLQEDKSQIKWRQDNELGFDLENNINDMHDDAVDINQVLIDDYEENREKYEEEITRIMNEFVDESNPTDSQKVLISSFKKDLDSLVRKYIEEKFRSVMFVSSPFYVPAERIFLAAIGESWAGIIRDDIGLPKVLVNFANQYSLARKNVSNLEIPFLFAKYHHEDGRDFIRNYAANELLFLAESASGIQSVAPMLVVLEHLSRNTEQAQSFIIEEPELNLFPLAQFELIKVLVDKCARTDGKNDLVLTTHSPYVLTALNLLCYAYRIAQQDETTAKKVAKLIPRHCWIDPAQFAAYYVDRPGTKRKQQVRSIINKKTGLIEENELDTASDELSSIFDKLVRLRKPAATSSRA